MKTTVRHLSAWALLGLLTCTPAWAVLQLSDTHLPELATDFRPGGQQPGVEQLAAAKKLKAHVSWNEFGTVHSMIRYGGFLATGLQGTPAEAAREWVRRNRVLFKLSEANVADLQLVNEGVMPHTDARAVLFRQRFNGMRVSHDGLITVGIVNGKIYYVSSSSAGDQPPPGPAVLSPLQAWIKAAADINRFVSSADIISSRDLTAKVGWNLFQVLGFTQTQRARLVALPIPAGGVRQAYETVVLDVQGPVTTAYVHFIDAETGAVLLRENRVQNQNTGTPLGEIFTGSLPDDTTCGIRHEMVAAEDAPSIRVIAHMAVPTNDTLINLYYVDPAAGPQQVGSYDLLAGTEVYDYSPAEGVKAGSTYQVEICPLIGSSVPLMLPPYNYVGSFATNSGAAANGLVYGTAKWRWFPAEPLLTLEDTDIRKVACFGPADPSCDYDVTNVAARQPWDMLAGTVPTFTTIGNAAITQESPYTAAIAGAPFVRVAQPNPTRNYDYGWTNAWYTSGCLPVYSAGAVLPVGNINDIDASITNLFVAHNRMHDWAYLLGFTERNYNMQLSNFGQTDIDVQNDPELGMAQAVGAAGGYPLYLGRDNANQATLQDGVPGITQQYLFQSIAGSFYAPCTDGAYSMAIVGHEYTHAISNRMIGGPDQGIGGQQGGSMGESWSDLAALEHMFGNGYLEGAAEPTALATYVSGGIGTSFRNYALADTPLNYSNVGYDTPGAEVHSDGEIWNATQWAVRQALVDQWQAQFPYEDRHLQQQCADGVISPEACPGNRRWIQIMFDSFLLMPSAPSMLDARDAELAADLARFGGANQEAMWRAFAARGMGEFAFSNGGNDAAPVGNFESPLAEEAEVTVRVLAADENQAPVLGAKVYIGDFSTRSRPVADTDPETTVDTSTALAYMATSNLGDTFRIVPGTYNVIVVAPGYGLHRFTRSFEAGKVELTFSLPTNFASLSKGAEVTTSATLAENQALKDSLIDDTEDTGARFGDVAPIAGASITVKLAGGEQTVSRVSISTAAGPDNPGRFTGVRAFEIRTCSGECSNPATDFENVAYVSAPDAFPARKARPLQPNLTARSFDFPAVKATHVQLRALSNQCTGNPEYAGEQDSDPLNDTDCASSVPPPNPLDPATLLTPGVGPGSVVRATEFQVFAHAAAEETAPGKKGGILGLEHPRFGGALGLPLLLPLLGFAALRRKRNTLH